MNTNGPGDLEDAFDTQKPEQLVGTTHLSTTSRYYAPINHLCNRITLAAALIYLPMGNDRCSCSWVFRATPGHRLISANKERGWPISILVLILVLVLIRILILVLVSPRGTFRGAEHANSGDAERTGAL